MKKFLLLLGSNLVSLSCIIGAIIMALNGVSGWGWLLFAGVVLSATL